MAKSVKPDPLVPKGPEVPIDQNLSLARRNAREEAESRQRPLDMGLIMRLFKYTKPYAFRRNALFAVVFLRGVQLPILAWMIGEVIRGPITTQDTRGIVIWAFAFLLFSAFVQLTMHFRQRLALQLGEGVVHDLRNEVMEHLLRQPMSYYNRTKLGRIISRITSDIEAMRTGVQNVFFVSMVQTMQGLVAAIFMVFINWKLFSVLLFMAPVLFLLHRYFRKRIGDASRQVQESFSRVTASLAESVKGIRVTQGFVREEINAGIFKRLVVDHSQYNLGLGRNAAVLLPLLELNSQFFIASIVFIGGYGVLSPESTMQAGDIASFMFLANLFFSPFTSLGQQFTAALAAMAGAERVFGLLDRAPDWQDPADALTPKHIEGRVEFRNVQFHYDPHKPVLKGINFTAEPGQTVALVGHTGSGKSTIINLISKFWIPTGGEVLIDGMDITKIQSGALHRQMGIVLQSNFLFSGRVIDNIRLGKLNATDDEVRAAVESLNCLDLIEAMSDGFETVVGERGSGLSLGQQQLVCFARAFLADPRIMILDEATSSVDTITEARLQEALTILLQNRTSFVIAHRLSTIRNADMVLVLDHGDIVERGTHTELLRVDGIYAGLYRQFVEA